MSDLRQASVTKAGNAQRAEWRQKCRQTLAAHISKLSPLLRTRVRLNLGADSTLGTGVEPAQVRLLPDLQDTYSWSVLPERKHLFTKQLSKHSVGAYMELCREVGKSFEAVVPASVTKESIDEESAVTLQRHLILLADICLAIPTLEFRYKLLLKNSMSSEREC